VDSWYLEWIEVSDWVYGTRNGGAAALGKYAEYTIVPEDRLVHLHDGT
jgi:NADPH:quinone reductase-like Zn-dependent oxidoreductase